MKVLLAYVPGLGRFVEPLGYRSLLEMGAEAMLPDTTVGAGVVWFLKRYVFWVLATVGLAVAGPAQSFGWGGRTDLRSPPRAR